MPAAAADARAAAPPSNDAEVDYARALLNILDDSAAEQQQLRDTQNAVLNILDDSAAERAHFRDTQTAMLNILEDFGHERQRQQGTERAILNIIEDFAAEKDHLEDMKRAVLNILEDLGIEKEHLEQAQTALRSSLLEKETLLKEIHHRVKNNLQVIISLLRLQSRYLDDRQAAGMFEESQNRIYSISLVHEMLYRTGDLAHVDFGDYVRSLAKHVLEGWRFDGPPIRVMVEAAGVQLPVDTAIPCGLIVTELITNSLKHAFPNMAAGSVWVTVCLDKDNRLNLTVRDDGIGLPENFDLRRTASLGLELVRTLTRQLRGSVEIERDRGTIFSIRFQLHS